MVKTTSEVGDFYYSEDMKLHREDGPAVILNIGHQAWYWNGKRHRADGPAIIFSNGIKHWYWMGTKIKCESQEEFERLLKLKVFW